MGKGSGVWLGEEGEGGRPNGQAKGRWLMERARSGMQVDER